MFKFLKFLFSVALLGAFLWFGFTVPLGKYTLFGHFRRIWNSKETQEMVDGTKEAAGPAVDKLKRGVKAGVDEASKETPPEKPSHSAPSHRE
jgi:hypothetical protein